MRLRYELESSAVLRILSFAEEELKSREGGGVAAVSDASGEIVGLLKIGAARKSVIRIAKNKAITAATEEISSSELGRRSREHGFPLTYFGDLRYTGWGGGEPIFYKEQIVGGVGVSGPDEGADIALARKCAEIALKEQ